MLLLVLLLSVSSCIVYELSVGDFYQVMCITSHLEVVKVICQDYSQSISLSSVNVML